MNGLSRAGAVALAAQVIAEWPLAVQVVALGMELPCRFGVSVELMRNETVIIDTFDGFNHGIMHRARAVLDAIQVSQAQRDLVASVPHGGRKDVSRGGVNGV